MGWLEVPRSLADRNPIDPDDPQAGRHNLMTAIQALSQQLPALRMMTLEKERRLPENARWAPGVGPDIKGQDRVYTLPDLVSDAAGFLPSSVDPIEVMAEVGPLDELLKAVTPFVARTMRGGEKAAPQGIRTYHGTAEPFSPEEGFPLGRFSNEKFRTGEGAMVRGAGHYMGEEVAVPRGYRSAAVQHDSQMMIGDRPIEKFYEDVENERERLWKERGKPGSITEHEQWTEAYDLEGEKYQIIEDLMIDGDLLGIEERAELGSYSDKALEWFDEEIAPKFSRKGALAEIDYQVSPEDLLHHDLPFAEQSEKVQDALTELVYRGSIAPSTSKVLRWEPDDPAVMKRIEELKAKAEAANDKVRGAIQQTTPQDWIDRDAAEEEFFRYVDGAQATGGSWTINPEATGIDIQHDIEQNLRASGMSDEAAAEAASMDLLDVDIRGLKFRDQGSRQPFTVKTTIPVRPTPENKGVSETVSRQHFSTKKEALEAVEQEKNAFVEDGQEFTYRRIIAHQKGSQMVQEIPPGRIGMKAKVELIEVPEEELTHNYVAFDPDDMMIQRWLALGGTGVGLHALTEEQRKAQSESQ